VLIARVVEASDPGTVFELTGVSSDRESLDIAYHLRKSSPASFKIAAWTGVVLGNGQLRERIEITEDGAMICSIDNRHKPSSLITPANARPAH
jgi:hypothetical protein